MTHDKSLESKAYKELDFNTMRSPIITEFTCGKCFQQELSQKAPFMQHLHS